jgi:transposase
MELVERAWAGIDAGKGHHHVVVTDGEGRRMLSRRVANDEPDLETLIAAIVDCATEVNWTIDLADGPAALVLALLLGRGQRVWYLPGVAVNRASDGYRGEGKTDAKDAAVIADQGRMRRDLRELRLDDPLIAELRMLTGHRADIAADRTRAINRLRIQLLGVSPALERALDFTNRGPLVLISHFQTPRQLAAAGQSEVYRCLRNQKVRHADRLAATAIRAAATQHTSVVSEATAAELIARLAQAVLDLDRQLAELDKQIFLRFEAHRHANVIASMVGIGALLGAEFLAATSGSLDGFASADHLAGYAGLAPAPRDSGRRSGNLHRPKRYNRQLQRVFYTSALISIQTSTASRAFYDRKRAEGKGHSQAVLALARRRVNVLWAMIRDHSLYDDRRSPSTLAA